MPTSDASANLRKSQEEEYFRKMELELIEKMGRQAELEAEHRHLAEAVGVTDDEILKGLKELGYTYQTVRLLHLVPLVQIAWIDGHVANREREQILQASHQLGVSEGSVAHHQLMTWLGHRPSEEFFQRTLSLIGRLLETLPPNERKVRTRELMFRCTKIASASGSIWGVGSKICQAERKLLYEIGVILERLHGTVT